MKEVLQILDQAGGKLSRSNLEHAVHRHTGGDLTPDLLAVMERQGLILCPNGSIELTDAGAARLSDAPPMAPPESSDGDLSQAESVDAEPPAPAPSRDEDERAIEDPPSEDPSPLAPIDANDAQALEERAQLLKDQGLSYMAIADRLGVPRPDVGRLLSAAARRAKRSTPRRKPPITPPRVDLTENAAAARAVTRKQAAAQEPEPVAVSARSEPVAPPAVGPGLVERLQRRRADLETQIALIDDVLSEVQAA